MQWQILQLQSRRNKPIGVNYSCVSLERQVPMFSYFKKTDYEKGAVPSKKILEMLKLLCLSCNSCLLNENMSLRNGTILESIVK
jgi:hypothetical protein